MIEGLIFFCIGIISYLLNKVIKIKKENYKLKMLIVENKFSINSENDIAKDDFLKFISDSREMAFDYIETVQNAFNSFKNAVEKDLEYFDKYGDVVAMQPNYHALEKISTAYKELKQAFPEEIKDA